MNYKNTLKSIFYYIEPILIFFLRILFPAKNKNYKNIPIIINSYNRLSYIVEITSYLTDRGYKNIYIIDNASTYPPLLDFYKKCPFRIFFLNENVGHLSLWKSGLYKKFIRDYYVYTDPDVIPIKECPEDFLLHFQNTLRKYKEVKKVGFSLKIDDIPDNYAQKRQVIEWESLHYKNKIGNDYYLAPIDTTFALYRPWAWGGVNERYKNLRTEYPYTAKHLPWYEDSANLSDESLFYIKTIKKSTHWSKLNQLV